jgi:DNA-directed RNA polymerase subunit P
MDPRYNTIERACGKVSRVSGTKGDSAKLFGSILYECERCGTKQTLEELSRFPEIRCKNCGYRSLKKARHPVAKRVDAV